MIKKLEEEKTQKPEPKPKAPIIVALENALIEYLKTGEKKERAPIAPLLNNELKTKD